MVGLCVATAVEKVLEDITRETALNGFDDAGAAALVGLVVTGTAVSCGK